MKDNIQKAAFPCLLLFAFGFIFIVSYGNFKEKSQRGLTSMSGIATGSDLATQSDLASGNEILGAKEEEPEELESIVEETEEDDSSSTRLNFAHIYPEDAEEQDGLHSYAGEIYLDLMQRDTKYIADIYDYAGVSPKNLSNRLGISTTRVLGKYDPDAEGHVLGDPNTYYIDSFKHVNFSFYDGDGNRKDVFSNVKEIMSMASVYCYYHEIKDPEIYRAICEEMYEKSRSYKVSIGSVYYDDGCIHYDEKEQSAEGASEEGAGAYGETESAAGSDTTSIDASGDVDAQKIYVSQEENPYRYDEIVTMSGTRYYVHYETDTATGKTRIRHVPVDDVIVTEGEAKAGESTDVDATSKEGDAPVGTGEASAETGETGSSQDGDATTDASASSALEQESQGAFQAEGQSIPADQMRYGKGRSDPSNRKMGRTTQLLAVNPKKVKQAGGFTRVTSVDQTASVSTMQNEEATETQGVTETFESSSQDSNVETEFKVGSGEEQTQIGEKEVAEEDSTSKKKKNYCHGHVDLNVQVKILGYEEEKGLRSLGLKSLAVVESEGVSANEGDTYFFESFMEEHLSEIEELVKLDWYEEYGLSVSSLNTRSPLTEEEVSEYLDSLPEEISEERRALIRFALGSVGKVPYYWGGKASVKGYEGNGFGKVTSPDHMGRIQKGLDCSGWIHWVYWSAIDNHLNNARGTGELMDVGRGIRRSDLRPGDIIVSPGEDSHAVMFLEWRENGKMLAIHENSGSNNVSVDEMTANYPYYRSILD